MNRITKFDPPTTPPEIDHPREERREIGAPERRTWMVYDSREAGMSAGIWECEVGRWRIQMDPNEHEYMIVLSGRARLLPQLQCCRFQSRLSFRCLQLFSDRPTQHGSPSHRYWTEACNRGSRAAERHSLNFAVTFPA